MLYIQGLGEAPSIVKLLREKFPAPMTAHQKLLVVVGAAPSSARQTRDRKFGATKIIVQQLSAAPGTSLPKPNCAFLRFPS